MAVTFQLGADKMTRMRTRARTRTRRVPAPTPSPSLKKGSKKLRELIAGKISRAAKLEAKWPQKCLRCGYKWKSRRKLPKFCSRCKTKAFNKSMKEAPIRRTRRRYWIPAKMGKNGH